MNSAPRGVRHGFRDATALRALLVSVIITTGIVVHEQRSGAQSAFQWTPEQWMHHSRTHLVHRVFYERPMTTRPALLMIEQLGLTPVLAYSLIWLPALCVLGWSCFVLGRAVTDSEAGGWGSLALTMLSWPMIHLFSLPSAAWDDPVQFMFLSTALAWFAVCWRQQRPAVGWAGYFIFYSLGLLARDSGLLLMPALLLLVLTLPERTTFATVLRTGTLVLSPATTLALWQLWVRQREVAWSPGIPRDQHARLNFANGWESLHSLTAAAAVLVPFCYLLVLSRRHLARRVWWALWVAVVPNTVVVLLATLAHEFRLFFLPVLVLAPIVGWAARDELALPFRRHNLMELLDGNAVVLLALVGLATVALAAYGFPGRPMPHRNLDSVAPLLFTALHAVAWHRARLTSRP
ncbi:hypothetical protein AAEX63_13010 [Luteococcus sp. H138]|uniref:hypothetical protein n=1 Tax=unclassified Luteococcus TaxID=2639923 RepID=UPI00313D96F2